jgi:putative endonuclease
MQFYVYILTNNTRGTLYIGVTNDLIRRVYEHRRERNTGFTGRYKVHKLVYFETIESAYSAITREKQLKKWNRIWKVQLIEKHNPDWMDLYNTLM